LNSFYIAYKRQLKNFSHAGIELTNAVPIYLGQTRRTPLLLIHLSCCLQHLVQSSLHNS